MRAHRGRAGRLSALATAGGSAVFPFNVLSVYTGEAMFELRHQGTGKLVHQYRTEGAALAFIRDVVRIGGHDQAAQFTLDERDERGQTRTIATGAALVRHALEDRVE